MFRATGSGEVEIDADYSSPGMLKASLYNFDFDDMHSTSLKKEHTKFLLEQAIPLLSNDTGKIWMQGSASRIGAATYNKTLSQARVKRVASFLGLNGISDSQMQLDAVGAELTANHGLDDATDRAVAFVILPRAKVDPPPPQVVPPKPLLSQFFKLALLGDVSALKTLRYSKYLKGKIGAGVAVDVMFFQIWDTTNNLACIYGYVGVGAGVGISKLPSFSTTLHGPWNLFKTSAEISSSQFAGPARFTTAAIGPESINYINLIGTPPGVDSVYEEIDTGTTIGAGLSSTVGDFILLEGPDPFNGP
jgi:hypothetical protein